MEWYRLTVGHHKYTIKGTKQFLINKKNCKINTTFHLKQKINYIQVKRAKYASLSVQNSFWMYLYDKRRINASLGHTIN